MIRRPITRRCPQCDIGFDDATEHAKHMIFEHEEMVLEVVNISNAKVVKIVTCHNSDRAIEAMMWFMLRNMKRDKFFIREFNKEARF